VCIRLLGILLFLGTGVVAADSAPPELRPRIGYPVLQEFMGGCSLRCAFFWETVAGTPQGPKKSASELCDDDASSFWISPLEGPGALIEFRIPKNLPPDCKDTPFYGISVVNGVIRSLDEFRDNARVKSMTLAVNQKPIARLRLADTWKWQDFHFPDILLNKGDVISLTVNDVYPGKKSSRPAMTEIVLQGAH
jgi:hypothetical protein